MQPQFRDFLAPRLRIDQEKLLNREIGLSGLYRDGRLAVRVALFAMRRDDAQLESWIYVGVNFLWVGFLDNAGGSNVGGEFEAEIRLGESWTLAAAIGVLDAEVDSIEVFDLDSAAFVTRDSIDQARAPAWQSNVALRWAGAGAWTAHVEVDARDGATFGYYHSGELSGHTLLNASLARRFGNTELALWARNLTDQDVEIHGLYFGNDPRKGWVNEAYYQYGEPRLIGLSLRHSF
jgi:hypothetical protein